MVKMLEFHTTQVLIGSFVIIAHHSKYNRRTRKGNLF